MATPLGKFPLIDATELASLQAEISNGTLKAVSPAQNTTYWRNVNYGYNDSFTSQVTGMSEMSIFMGGTHGFTVTGTTKLKCIFSGQYEGFYVSEYYAGYTIDINRGTIDKYPASNYLFDASKTTLTGLHYVIDIDGLDPNRFYTIRVGKYTNYYYGIGEAFDSILVDPTGIVIPGQTLTHSYQQDRDFPKKHYGLDRLSTPSDWSKKYARGMNLKTYYNGWKRTEWEDLEYTGFIDSKIDNVITTNGSVNIMSNAECKSRFTVKDTKRVLILGYVQQNTKYTDNGKIYVDCIYAGAINFKGEMVDNQEDAVIATYPELWVLDDIFLPDLKEHTIEIVKPAGGLGSIDCILTDKGSTINKYIPINKVDIVDSFILEKDGIYYTRNNINKIEPTMVDNTYRYRIPKADFNSNTIEYQGLKDLDIITPTNKFIKYRDASHISVMEFNDKASLAEVNTATSSTDYTLATFISNNKSEYAVANMKAVDMSIFANPTGYPENQGITIGGTSAYSTLYPNNSDYYRTFPGIDVVDTVRDTKCLSGLCDDNYNINRKYFRAAFKTTSSFISIWAKINLYYNNVYRYTPYHYSWNAIDVSLFIYVNGKRVTYTNCIFKKANTPVLDLYGEVVYLSGLEPDDLVEILLFAPAYDYSYAGIGIAKDATITAYWKKDKFPKVCDVVDLTTDIATSNLTDMDNDTINDFINTIFDKDDTLEYVDIVSKTPIDNIHLRSIATGMYPIAAIPARDIGIKNGFSVKNLNDINNTIDVSQYKLLNIHRTELERYKIYGTTNYKFIAIDNINLVDAKSKELIREIIDHNQVRQVAPLSTNVSNGYSISVFDLLPEIVDIKEVM